MSASRQIALYHFKRVLFKKSYLLTLLSLPLFLAFIIGLIWVTDTVENDETRLGVVDPGGFIEISDLPEGDSDVFLLFFPTKERALDALQAETGDLNAVYILPENYPQDFVVEVLYEEPPPSRAGRYFRDIVRLNLLNGQPKALQERVLSGADVLIRATEAHREFPATHPTADLFIPLMMAIIYMFAIIPISGIMLGALGDEKVNRTIEVIMTSVSPRTLISGKVIAVSAIALVQISAWVLFLVLAVRIGGQGFGVEWMQGIQVPWRDAGAVILLAVPGFVFYGASLVLIGSLIDDAEALAQAGGLVFIPMFLPIYVLPVLLEQPGSTLALVFAMLPFTSVQTVGIQSIFMQVPAWRILTAAGISWLSAAGMIWLAARAFRVGMLRYGQRIRLRELLRPASDSPRGATR